MATIDFGISLYSYTQEYTKNQFDLETCIQRCSLHGAKQLEIVGSQMLKSYPYVTEQEANEVKALSQKYDVELLSYGANTDKGLRSDRDLNDDELFHIL